MKSCKPRGYGFHWNFRAFKELPRYFNEFLGLPWLEYEPDKGYIKIHDVFKMWWILEWHKSLAAK